MAGEQPAERCRYGCREAELVVGLAGRAWGRTTGSPSGGKPGLGLFRFPGYCAEAGARPGGGSSPLFKEATWEESHQDGRRWSAQQRVGLGRGELSPGIAGYLFSHASSFPFFHFQIRGSKRTLFRRPREREAVGWAMAFSFETHALLGSLLSWEGRMGAVG